MKSDYAIEVSNVKKKFKVYFDKGNSIKDKILFWSRNKHEEHWVLNGISFCVKKGEAIGLIGRNGCGKSTTLKLINRIMYPTFGEIKINGRVSSLIELGAGFHPDMTGRENIYTNASIFGMTHSEIEEKIDEIIEFSELGEYIDNPVRTYSSGMYMRLGFSVAINVKADILLIDEILAVGDVSFQKKCFEKLQEIKAQGVTIVIVSHSMGQIESICDKVVWIEKGKIKELDTPSIVGAHYNSLMEAERLGKEEKKESTIKEGGFSAKASRIGDGRAQYTSIQLNSNGQPIKSSVIEQNSALDILLEYKSDIKIEEYIDFRLCFIRNDGVQCYGASTLGEELEMQLKPGGSITFHISDLSLLPGKYRIDISIKLRDGTILDYIYYAKEIHIKENRKRLGEFGILSMKHCWK